MEPITVRQLSEKLSIIEAEIAIVRRQLKQLERPSPKRTNRLKIPTRLRSNKVALQAQMNVLLSTLGIQDDVIGIEALQQAMQKADLAPNELSQSLIAMREE
jgi:hypothetical protein